MLLAFGMHVARSGAREIRTIVAMSAGSVVGLLLCAACRGLGSVHRLTFHDAAQTGRSGEVTARAD